MFLDDKMLETLRSLAQQRSTTVSQIVREAVMRFIEGGAKPGVEGLGATGGLWAVRTDLPSTEAYVRDLRRGTRRRKGLGLD